MATAKSNKTGKTEDQAVAKVVLSARAMRMKRLGTYILQQPGNSLEKLTAVGPLSQKAYRLMEAERAEDHTITPDVEVVEEPAKGIGKEMVDTTDDKNPNKPVAKEPSKEAKKAIKGGKKVADKKKKK